MKLNKRLVPLFVFIVFGTTVAATYNTITIDGINDFESDEDIAGTSGAAYYITWDADNLYLGLQAPDVASGSSTRWVNFYIDSDPQPIAANGSGTTNGLMYNTQQPALPFTANYHLRWRANNTYTNLQVYNGSAWVDGNQTNIAASHIGSFVEYRIPLANIGSPAQIYLVGSMINESSGSEWTYYQTPQNGHADGYDQNFVSRLGFNLIEGISPDNPAYIDAALPVELTSFSAAAIGSTVILNWQTAAEVNNFGFEIEKTNAGKEKSPYSWVKVGFVKGHGNSNSPKDYSFSDAITESGKYLYRLKQIDNDGQYEYSGEVEVNMAGPLSFSLQQNYPNPFNPSTTIMYQLPYESKVTLKVYDILGSEAASLVNEVQTAGYKEVKFGGSKYSSGVYIYRLTAESSNGTTLQ